MRLLVRVQLPRGLLLDTLWKGWLETAVAARGTAFRRGEGGAGPLR